MKEFLSTGYGMAIFIAFDVLAVIAVIALLYRVLFKRLFDMLFSLLAMLLLSPIFLYVVLRGKSFKKQAGIEEGLIERNYFVGKKAKTVRLHTFRTEFGIDGGYPAMLQRTRFFKLPLLADVFLGRLSFVGVRPLRFADAAFVSESDEARYSVRAGLINPMIVRHGVDAGYEEMFASDCDYAGKVGLFKDFGILMLGIIEKIRGEKTALRGEKLTKTYAETLLAEGKITKEDFDTVTASAAEEEAELRK